MKQSKDGSLLHMPLSSMALSKSFKNTANINGYYTLQDILAIPLTELVQKDWFTASMFEELSQIVKGSKA